MTKKRTGLLACLLALVMVFAMTACTAQPAAESPAAEAPAAETPATKAPEAEEEDPAPEEAPAAEAGAINHDELYQIEMFNTYANYMGIQPGWYGKILKDRFNLELNIIAPQVAGTGETLYQTRSAAGNLGDIIVTGKTRLADCYKAGLLMDMTPYIDNCPNLLKLSVAYEKARSVVGDGVGLYCIPGRVSNLPATQPAGRGVNPEAACFLRWDWYYELGCPEIADMEGLLDVLAQLQEAHPTNDNGDKVYALSAFPSWDGAVVRAAREFTCMYGYGDVQGFYASTSDGSTVINHLDDGGLYYQMLQWWNKAYRMGLVDPDSSTQKWDDIAAKANDGRIIFSWWSYLGANIFSGTYKVGESNPGYAMVPIGDSLIRSPGYNQYGMEGNAYAMGSQVKYPERIMEFMDYYASPEGMLEQNGHIEGVTYEMIDGRPVLTEFALNQDPNKEAPAEMGGGLWSDGSSQINYPLLHSDDINSIIGEPCNSSIWASTLESGVNEYTKQWNEVFGAANPNDYLTSHNKFSVIPGTDYTAPVDPSDIATMRAQLYDLVKTANWQMIYAESDEEFATLWQDMKAQLPDYGIDELNEYDMAIVEENIAARRAVLGLE